MTLFYVRGDRSTIPPQQKDAAREEIEQRAKQLNPADPGYQAALVQVIDEVVTTRANTFRWGTDDARILRAELANLAVNNLSVYLQRRDEMKARQAHTALEDAKGIQREEDLICRSFTRVSPAEAKVHPEELMQTLRGLGRLAASLGAPRAADGWYAREVSQTVEGDRANNLGQYGKRARRFMMPFAEVRSLALSNAENGLLHEVLRNNRQGVDDGLSAMLACLPGADKANTGDAKKSFLMPPNVLNRVNLLGTQLEGFRQYVDRLRPTPKESFPELRDALGHNHRVYVNRNYTQIPADLRKPFDELEPVVQRRNIPNMLGALYGLMQANRLVGDVLERGILLDDGSPTDSGNDLQLHLVSSASHAMTLDFDGANSVFAGAVADEIALLMAHHNGTPEQLTAIHDAVEAAVLDAGNAFRLGGPKAKAAPSIALRHFGEVMKAMYPDVKTSVEDWNARAAEVLGRARVEDLALVAEETFGLQKLPQGAALVEQLKKEVDAKDYFFDRIDELKPRSETDVPLTKEERAILRNLLYLANATWKQGQVHRAIGEGDLTRINPSERERVFNPYDMTVTAAPSSAACFFIMAKDFLILK